MASPRIVQVEYAMPRPKPVGLLDPKPVVSATFDDGTRQELFSFYPDEIRFDEGEPVGLTEAEVPSLSTEGRRLPSNALTVAAWQHQ